MFPDNRDYSSFQQFQQIFNMLSIYSSAVWAPGRVRMSNRQTDKFEYCDLSGPLGFKFAGGRRGRPGPDSQACPCPRHVGGSDRDLRL